MVWRLKKAAVVDVSRWRAGHRRRYDTSMVSYRATVRNGRLVLDEPTDLPDGEVVELHTDGRSDEEDDLDDESRRALRAALRRGIADFRAGRTRTRDEVLATMRAAADAAVE